MLKVDRANFAVNRFGAYHDSPQTIGYGQTISAPHMHAYVLEVCATNIMFKHSKQDEFFSQE